jgi:putative PEP-CTERM system TPR-repeat lipoprotein
MSAKDKDAAMQSLRKALSVKPDSVDALRGIVMLDLDAGRTAEAIEATRRFQKQYPANVAGYLLEGDAYVLGKSWREAVEAYRKGIKQTGAVELAIKLHAALVAQNAVAEADKFAEGWLASSAKTQKDNRFRLYIAESSASRKDYAAAARHYRVLLDSQPNNPVLMNNLAWNLGQINDPKAIEMAEKALKLAPEQPSVMDTLGMLLVGKGDLGRGTELLRKAASMSKEPGIQVNLARALIKAGKKDEAKGILEEVALLGDKYSGLAEVKELLAGLK